MLFYFILKGICRTVKMGWNSRGNPAHHRFGTGWVEIFLQISIRVDFWPGSFRTRLIWVEPVVSRVGSPTRR